MIRWFLNSGGSPRRLSTWPRINYASWLNSLMTDLAAERANVTPVIGGPRQALRALPQSMLLSAAMALGTGCHHKTSPVAVAPPPALAPPPAVSSGPSSAPSSVPASSAPVLPATVADSPADAEFVGSHP